jgi:transcriptional regulator with XRE-family HTH domain
MTDREEGWRRLGDFIKAQRQLHDLSLRQLAEIAKVSNPYLSQLERGKYKPSIDVLSSIGAALRVSTETMLAQAGLLSRVVDDRHTPDVEAAVRLDTDLTTEQKEALISVYRGFRGPGASAPASAARRRPAQTTPATRSRRTRA